MSAIAVAYFRDDFQNNIIDPCWAASVTGSATVAETGGQAVLTLPSSTAGSHQATYRTTGTYDLTGDGFYWNIATMVATGVAATAQFQLLFDTFGANQVYWRQVSNAITARYIVAGVDTQLFTATWSATTYKYLRIRESAGTTYWDSSTNGTSWTNRASLANPFAMTSLYVQFAALCGNVASPGSLKLDDVNLILPALSTTWHWTQVEWPLENRFKVITIAATSGQGYIATADSVDSSGNLVSPLYYSGPLGSASGNYASLTIQASQALAQAMAPNLPLNGRWDLPNLDECRFIRLYHRSITGSSYTLREYYPRRLVQSDDIEAESIRAVNISAHSITADQISTINLDALARITAGAGAVSLDNNGISVIAEIVNVYNPESAYSWYLPDAVTRIGDMYAAHEVNHNRIVLEGLLGTGDYAGEVTLFAEGTTGSNNVLINATGGRAAVVPTLTVSLAGGDLTFTATNTSVSGNTAIGDSAAATTRLRVKGASATSSDYAMVVVNSTPTAMFVVRNDNKIGVLGATEVGRQNVTGSRAGNAALASLLTAMAAFGWITDSSTV